MTSLILATALSAFVPSQTDSVGRQIPASPVARSTASFTHSAAADTVVKRAPVLGADKVQHAFMSYAVGVFTYGAARSAKVDADAASAGALGASIAIGIGKEFFDARHGRPFSGYDLVADAVGALASYAIIRQVH